MKHHTKKKSRTVGSKNNSLIVDYIICYLCTDYRRKRHATPTDFSGRRSPGIDYKDVRRTFYNSSSERGRHEILHREVRSSETSPEPIDESSTSDDEGTLPPPSSKIPVVSEVEEISFKIQLRLIVLCGLNLKKPPLSTFRSI